MISSTPVQHLYTGIFSDERILQILHIMQTLSDNCFSKLHEVANEGRPSTTEYAIRFRKGLDSIEFWKQNIKNEETKQAVLRYKELPILYKYAIVRYLKELFKHDERQVIPVNIPPLQDFIHSYYSKLAKTSYMQKLEFLNVYGLERTHMHMEALRSVLMDFARDSIYQTPMSSSVMGDKMPDNQPIQNNIRGLVRVERDVTPWDSVSQRGEKPFQDDYQDNNKRDNSERRHGERRKDDSRHGERRKDERRHGERRKDDSRHNDDDDEKTSKSGNASGGKESKDTDMSKTYYSRQSPTRSIHSTKTNSGQSKIEQGHTSKALDGHQTNQPSKENNENPVTSKSDHPPHHVLEIVKEDHVEKRDDYVANENNENDIDSPNEMSHAESNRTPKTPSDTHSDQQPTTPPESPTSMETIHIPTQKKFFD